MPRNDPRRAHAAALQANEHLNRRQMPAPYPAGDPVELYSARLTSGRPHAARDADAVLVQMRDGALELLRQAVELERRAHAAQACAVQALRTLGPASPPWPVIGLELGLSGQGAHKRYRSLEERERQATIDDELEAARA
jgi:hypothetical protein